MSLTFWDVGGQKSLRSFWRNYFEQTDGIIWVVDSADRRRLEDCKAELDKLLLEEKLAGATLCVFANKQDLPGALNATEIAQVRCRFVCYLIFCGKLTQNHKCRCWILRESRNRGIVRLSQ